MESPKFQGFGCSECNWRFDPSGVRFGDSLQQMKREYEAEREREFATHVCVEHAVLKGPKTA
jgi:hypothetical protein